MNTATVPTPVQDVQGDNRWMSMHNRFVAQGKRREVEVLFIGDSLVQQLQFSPVWEKLFVPLHSINFGVGGDATHHVLWRIQNGELDHITCKVWEKMFVPLHCLNFGIGKDETQHVLWRLQNGELDSLSPKVVVLLVGTNNHDHSADQVVEGILAIVNTIEEKQPEAQTVVVGIPPRGQNPNKLREKITKINQSLASKLSNEPRAVFVNVDAGLFEVKYNNKVKDKTCRNSAMQLQFINV
ncbi:unnamed protein product [Owenia fusiformis]|uniref:SGNH hydrolase-type esterase domain-containing protein n=1 Tax=Owenia fusiformis TaxID=6347 RepID=A0A8S4PTX3_OWEFU|nr:unnamed protein product [Owenia fusiformis]